MNIDLKIKNEFKWYMLTELSRKAITHPEISST